MLQQEITDAADGEDILIVAHWDAVSGSIARLRPWAIADHVIHTGFTVSWREKQEGEPLGWIAGTCNVKLLLSGSSKAIPGLRSTSLLLWSAEHPHIPMTVSCDGIARAVRMAQSEWHYTEVCRICTDGSWGKWRLETKNGENGVHWVEAFKPIYLAGSATKKVYNVASSIVGKVNPFYHRKHHHHDDK